MSEFNDLTKKIAEENGDAKFRAAYIGRFDFSDPAGPVFGWPGSHIKACFKGTGISVHMKPLNAEENENWFNIILDGEVLEPLLVNEDGQYTLASGLIDEIHEITIWKRTGAASGELQFFGFIPEKGGTLLPPPSSKDRRIEFIGDSITCGYGNEAANAKEGYKSHQENNYLAFGSIASRELGADHISIGWGGRGVYRNYGGETYDTMPEFYPRTLPKQADKLWDFKSWIPHAVVINLGTNDFASSGLDTEAFVQSYVKLVRFIRSNYPDAHIFCMSGPMDHRAEEYLIRLVNEMNTEGDKNVHFVLVPLMDGKSEGVGGNWHPSVKTHLRVGKQLAESIRERMGW